MTPQEAVEWLEAIEEKYIHGGDNYFDEKRKIAINNAITALEKQIPKKVVQERLTETLKPNCCPVCNHRHYDILVPYCRFCGQALDWGDTE